ncbi:MAG: type 2 isopentenyl-diphosphate Delta-isomerase [Myxococcaceae bacterium]
MPDDATARRKDAHLDLCASAEVEPVQNRTLLGDVRLVHCAMPELAITDLELSTELFGKKLKAPLMVTGMTGGTDRAGQVNRDLARLAEKHGLPFGVGSQRAMLDDPSRAPSFQIREVAPNTVVIGNIGLTQAVRSGVDGVRRLMDAISADGMAVHLNAGQELTQPEGDRDFRGGYQAIEKLAKAMPGKLLVKETGCGISPHVARRLVDAGVRVIDVSGLGGTSWVRVEQLRAEGPAAEVGETFSSWGIPTAAAIATVRKAVGTQVTLIASGGIRDGLDAAKALALGADFAGMALPLFKAQQAGGFEAADRALEVVLTGVKHALLLTGSRKVSDLRERPRVVTGELKDWVTSL